MIVVVVIIIIIIIIIIVIIIIIIIIIIVTGGKELKSNEGTTQGDPLAVSFFAISLQPSTKIHPAMQNNAGILTTPSVPVRLRG